MRMMGSLNRACLDLFALGPEPLIWIRLRGDTYERMVRELTLQYTATPLHGEERPMLWGIPFRIDDTLAPNTARITSGNGQSVTVTWDE